MQPQIPESIPPTGEGLTFEKVWAMFLENRLQMQETDRRFKETEQEFKEIANRFKDTDRLIGRLGNRFGDLIEHLIAPNLSQKFKEIGFYFTRLSQNIKLTDPITQNFLAEIDILLENGDIVIAVEVKAKPSYNDVNDCISKMEILRQDASRRGDNRKYRCAIAGAIMSPEIKRAILNHGFYLIEQTGDTVKITIPEGFTPREW